MTPPEPSVDTWSKPTSNPKNAGYVSIVNRQSETMSISGVLFIVVSCVLFLAYAKAFVISLSEQELGEQFGLRPNDPSE